MGGHEWERLFQKIVYDVTPPKEAFLTPEGSPPVRTDYKLQIPKQSHKASVVLEQAFHYGCVRYLEIWWEEASLYYNWSWTSKDRSADS